MSETTIRLPTEQLAWLKHALQKGVDSVEQGRTVPFDPEDVKRRGRARLATRKKRARG